MCTMRWGVLVKDNMPPWLQMVLSTPDGVPWKTDSHQKACLLMASNAGADGSLMVPSLPFDSSPPFFVAGSTRDAPKASGSSVLRYRAAERATEKAAEDPTPAPMGRPKLSIAMMAPSSFPSFPSRNKAG